MRKQISQLCVIFVVMLFNSSHLEASIFGPPPHFRIHTLASTLEHYEYVLLVQWVDSKTDEKKKFENIDDDPQGKTTFEVLDIAKQNKKEQIFKKSEMIILNHLHEAEKGDLFLLLGDYHSKMTWEHPYVISKLAFHHMQKAPNSKVSTKKRLLFFLDYFEDNDPIIAYDAYEEFYIADFNEISAIKDKLPHDKIIKWLTDEKTFYLFRSLYGKMLGLCGTEKDIILLEKIIFKPLGKNDLRIGFGGIIGGYLLLSGNKGLALIEKEQFLNKECIFCEAYSGMLGIRFMWDHGEGRISKDRLRQSMRILLNRPSMADMVVEDLARWKDWSVQDKLMKLYFTEDYDVRSIQISIIRYFLACAADMPKDSKLPEPAHVTKAKANLKRLEAKDPKIVKAAKRYFFIR